MSSIRVHLVAESTRMLAARAAQAADRVLDSTRAMKAAEQIKAEGEKR